MALKWYLQREWHGDVARGASPELRVIVGAETITLAGAGELDGVWTIEADRPPSRGPREPGWGVALDRDGRAALLSMRPRPAAFTLELDDGPRELPVVPAPVPEWLRGRWVVDASRLEPAELAEVGDGVVEIDADRLAHHGFAPGSGIFDQAWSAPQVHTTETGVRLDCDDFDEVWLDVRARDGDRLVVYLGGVDALPWGRELPLKRAT